MTRPIERHVRIPLTLANSNENIHEAIKCTTSSDKFACLSAIFCVIFLFVSLCFVLFAGARLGCSPRDKARRRRHASMFK